MLFDLIKQGRFYYEDNKKNREDILRNSLKCFRITLKYAYKKSSFYKEYYKSHNIKFQDLDEILPQDIPVIDKKTVIDNFFEIATEGIDRDKYKKALEKGEMLPSFDDVFIVHTSGSTGTPCPFLYSRQALVSLESNFARLSVTGENRLSLKDFPIKSLYVAPVGSGYACTALALFGMKQYHCKNIIIDAKTPLEEWREKIKDYDPLYLSGYPSCINLIAELQQKGELNLKPKKIITGGEPLSPEYVKYFKNVFKADIVDYYGCTESILIGAGGSAYEGIYLFDDLNYIEADEKSRLIITPFYNHLFPLIRYKTGDIAENMKKQGYGSLPYTHIDRISGRQEDLIWLINENGQEDFLHPLFLDDLSVKGLLKYQFVKTSDTSFTLNCILTDKNTDKEIERQLKTFLTYKNMNNIKFRINPVNELYRDPKSGKVKLIIN